MAKKIRFPLKLSEGAEARTLDELREHFDLQAVLEYYKNGKLLTWLEDRYLEGEAEAIQALDETAPGFQRQLCEIFQVEYSNDDVDLEDIERRQERLKKLRAITDNVEFIQNIDCIAFDQEELADLLDEDKDTIYLCGEKFIVPASRKGITYVGIKAPTIHISGKVPEEPEKLGIKFVGVNCDNLPVISEPEAEAANCQEDSVGGEISLETLRAIPNSKALTDHYALICRQEYDEQEGEDADVLYIRSLFTDQEIRLTEDAMEAILGEYDDIITSGDEICCRGENDDGEIDCFILDLASNEIIYSQDDLDGRVVVAFDSNFIVFYSDEDDPTITILDRHTEDKENIFSLEDDENGDPQFLLNGKHRLTMVNTPEYEVLGVKNQIFHSKETRSPVA